LSICLSRLMMRIIILSVWEIWTKIFLVIFLITLMTFLSSTD
jgi:hypothetical protein